MQHDGFQRKVFPRMPGCFLARFVVLATLALVKLSRTPAGSTCHPAQARRGKCSEDRSREKQGRDGGAQ